MWWNMDFPKWFGNKGLVDALTSPRMKKVQMKAILIDFFDITGFIMRVRPLIKWLKISHHEAERNNLEGKTGFKKVRLMDSAPGQLENSTMHYLKSNFYRTLHSCARELSIIAWSRSLHATAICSQKLKKHWREHLFNFWKRRKQKRQCCWEGW